ncbi:MAG TPA: polymer-forming cytoskeletal protein, partial [Chitinophagaceae bacterium]|nr:polymer-forming cytoskeletal protein [Chitinophagaceae bacterium]
MFNKEKNPISEKQYATSATLISAGTTLTGDVHSENDLRIDGTVYGNVTSTSKIIIGPTGIIEGNIDGQQADITGKVTGNIAVRELLQLRGQCDVQGNIHAAKLQVDPTAQFNGQVQMGNSGQ